ncbi:MAG TPA: cytochrome c oxidase subunit 3 [Gammaproteobacteria bacterium]|nr:cytochrome c oxidase subunit 3 [Gammaproteobacteria bacterium]
MSSLSRTASSYYVPQQSQWPIVAGCALLLTTLGAATWINSGSAGPYVFAGGMGLLLCVLIGWFGTVIRESEAGAYNAQVDRSFHWAMGWFIFSETTFFAAFFGALFYLRWHAAPDLASGDTAQLWPGFAGGWPATGPAIEGALQPMRPVGIALINTLILLTSAATLLWARRGLQKGARGQLKLGLAVTVALGILFLCLQVSEYYHAYTAQGLTLASGAYGATFFLLTGFHGLHVGVGATVLTVIFGRSAHGDFTPDDHFGLSAAAWYWQFVDVIWLLLYVLVYWL